MFTKILIWKDQHESIPTIGEAVVIVHSTDLCFSKDTTAYF